MFFLRSKVNFPQSTPLVVPRIFIRKEVDGKHVQKCCDYYYNAYTVYIICDIYTVYLYIVLPCSA